jgi:biopolymer transport protein ExbB/TolQ
MSHSNCILNWTKSDPEQRLGFSGGLQTRVNLLLTGILALLLTAIFYGMMYPFRTFGISLTFYREGSLIVSSAILYFANWSLLVLYFKSCKLKLQRQALSIQVVPHEPDFVLSPATVEIVQHNLHSVVDDISKFILFHRIQIAISNLKNLGRVGDVADILKTQAEYDEATMETSYLIVSAFVWAIPVLGFIGTVLGLSQAIGDFGAVLSSATDIEVIKSKLQDVTGGLSTAFETTLQGLVAAMIVQLYMVWMKKTEQEFLDECNEYCSRYILGKLRLLME